MRSARIVDADECCFVCGMSLVLCATVVPNTPASSFVLPCVIDLQELRSKMRVIGERRFENSLIRHMHFFLCIYMPSSGLFTERAAYIPCIHPLLSWKARNRSKKAASENRRLKCPSAWQKPCLICNAEAPFRNAFVAMMSQLTSSGNDGYNCSLSSHVVKGRMRCL